MEMNKEANVILSAIHPVLEENMIDSTETEVRGREWIAWGKNNDFGEYLAGCYKDCATLQAIINQCVDYSCGDDLSLNIEPYKDFINDKGQTVQEVVRNAFFDYWTYGGFALSIIRNKLGGIAGVYYVNIKNLRSDKKNTMFYYSEDWSKSYGRVKTLAYPAFDPTKKQAISILYVKRSFNGTYPVPVYGAAVKAVEIEKAIDTFHLNAINNNFSASYIISFNDGVPNEQQQEEIVNDIEERFSGYQNAARIMVAFNRTKDNAISVEKLDSEDFGTHYQVLADWSQQEIFTAFRANPNLIGIPTKNLGFSTEEYSSSFKLFSKTQILPSQRLMCDSFKKIFGEECLVIEPFTIDFNDEGTNGQNKVIE